MPNLSSRHVLLALLGLLLLPCVMGPAWADDQPAVPPAPAPLPLPLPGAPIPLEEVRHLQVDLVSETATVEPGTSVLVGIRLEIENLWHVYWKNPGDSGLPFTVLEWHLPDGWSAGEILWPAPRTLPLGPLVNYGYEGTFVLPVRLEVPADAPEGKISLSADLDWLVCHEECDPGNATRTLELTVSKATPSPGLHQKLFDAAKVAWPKAFPPGTGVSARGLAKAMELVLTGPGPWTDPDSKLYAFLETDGSDQQRVEPAAEQKVTRTAEATTLRLLLPKGRKKAPETLVGMLVVEGAQGRTAFALDMPVAEPTVVPASAGGPPWPPDHEAPVPEGVKGGPPKGSYTVSVLPTVLTSSSQVVDALSGAYTGETEEKHPLWLLLLGALVGGIILNIMPCVLPVLSIKVLGFVSQADEHPAKARRHAYAFAIGVLTSFWFLAAVILVIRETSKGLGWGFHFQSPEFVAAMAVLMFAVGMNLTGAFEFGLSVQSLAGDAATKIHSGGYAGSFWSGALATVIATPCTAPMMGPAVGYAMTAPHIDCVLVFTFLGVGMALPYVLLSMSPRLLKKMPRPGPWMETFKHALAFPMFATVLWLGFVLADHVGAHGVLWMFTSLLVLGLALWIYGQWGTPSTTPRKRWIVGYGLALLAAFGAWRVMGRALNEKPPRLEQSEEGSYITWEKWSQERVAWRLSQGYVVFVDFTAKWCASCQVNEQTCIDTEPVRQAIEKYKVVMLKADMTKEDPAIVAGLAEFGRSSVPLYLTYRPLPASKTAPSTAPAGK